MFVLKKAYHLFSVTPRSYHCFSSRLRLLYEKKFRLSALILAGFAYLFSIEPTAAFLLKPLENLYKPPPFSDIRSCGAYVVLGGGALENVPDMDGRGMLGASSLPRVITAYRLYKEYPKPIVISSGKIFNRK